MTSALHVIDQISEQLVCAICLERLAMPRVLNCMHTFCTDCLHRIANNDSSQSITCPTCRMETPIPETGIKGMKINFFVNQMLELVKVKVNELQEIRQAKNCESCEDSESGAFATSRCVDCGVDLCTSCVAEHKRSHDTLDHRIISTTDGEDGEDEQLDRYSLSFCRYHTRNVIKYFCITCDEAICRVCTILEHREHEYVYPKEALPLKRNDVNELLEKAKSRIPELKNTLVLVDDMSRRLKDCHQALARDIHNNTQIRIKALLDAEQNLLRQLANINISKQKVLGLQKDSIELEIGKLTGCCEFADNVMKYGNEVEILQMKGRLETLNDLSKIKLDPEEDDTVQYICDNNTIKTVIESVGRIHASSTFASISFASGEGIHTARVKVEAHFKLHTKDRRGARSFGGDRVFVQIKQPDGSELPVRVEDKGDGTYIVYYTPHVNGHHHAVVTIQDKPIMDSPFTILVVNRREYQEIGPTIMKFGQYGCKKREFKSPFGVAVDQEGRIYVADSYNHRIQTLGSRGEYITSFGSHGDRKGEFNCPTDVTIDHRGRIIVCDNGNNRIQVLNKNGGFIGKFGREGVGNGYFKSPWGVAVTRRNEILVADMENNRIQMFSHDGKFMFKFGSPGDRPGQLNAPCYLVMNNDDDQILVSDSKNHRIQVFDTSGKYVRHFGAQGNENGQFTHPRGIAMDIAGNIIVADMGNHRLQILNPQGQFVKEVGTEGNGDGQLSFPESVAIMPNSGYIVVSDLSNNRIHVF